MRIAKLLPVLLMLVASSVLAVDNTPTATTGTRNGDVCWFSGTTSTLPISTSLYVGSIKWDNATNGKDYAIYTNKNQNFSLTSESLIWRHRAETGYLSGCDQLGSILVPPGGFQVYQETTASLFIYLKSP